MTMNASLHDPVAAEAHPHAGPGRGWVVISDAAGNTADVHTTIERARAIEAVFAEHHVVRIDGLRRSEGGYEPIGYHTDMIASGRGELLP